MTTGMKAIIYGVAAVIAISLVIALSPFTIVDAGERGVVTRVGAYSRVMGPGIHWLTPLVEGVTKFDVRTQKEETDASAASKDLQTVNAKVAVNYNVNPDSLGDLYVRIGSEYKAKIIDPAVQEVVKAVTAQYTAEELITKRAEVTDKILNGLKESVQARAEGNNLTVTAVSIVNFDFSKSFNEAIENKVTAEQNALAAKNKLEQIKYEAQQTIETAKATAEAQRIQSQSLAAAGGEDYVALKAIEKWNGILPVQMIPGSSVPFINLTK